MVSRIFDHRGLRDGNPDPDSERRGQAKGQHVGDERNQLRVVRCHLEAHAESDHEFVTSNCCNKGSEQKGDESLRVSLYLETRYSFLVI